MPAGPRASTRCERRSRSRRRRPRARARASRARSARGSRAGRRTRRCACCRTARGTAAAGSCARRRRRRCRTRPSGPGAARTQSAWTRRMSSGSIAFGTMTGCRSLASCDGATPAPRGSPLSHGGPEGTSSIPASEPYACTASDIRARFRHVVVVPELRRDVRGLVRVRRHGRELGADRRPAPLRLHPAVSCLRAGLLGAETGAVRDLVEAVPERLRSDRELARRGCRGGDRGRSTDSTPRRPPTPALPSPGRRTEAVRRCGRRAPGLRPLLRWQAGTWRPARRGRARPTGAASCRAP